MIDSKTTHKEECSADGLSKSGFKSFAMVPTILEKQA